jgi:ribosomal protein S18 acetylase RimI-like enzyme
MHELDAVIVPSENVGETAAFAVDATTEKLDDRIAVRHRSIPLQMVLRSLNPGDIAELHRLEAEAYLPELHESDESFLQLMRLYPEGAFGYFDEEGLCGYAFAAPSMAGTTLELRTPVERIPEGADTFYIHDVAVAARCRGRGIGRLLATRLLALAREQGFARTELVSVQGSAPFWRRFGFETVYEFEYVPGAPSVKMARDM